MKTTKELLFIIIISVTSVANATTYYVSNSGNDSAVGTSPSAAWQTLSKVGNLSFNAGDSILLKCGDVWRETLSFNSSGDSTHHIVISSYGTGDRPKIIGSEQIMNWSHLGGNIWSSAADITDPNPTYPSSVWFIETDGSVTWGNAEKSDTASLTEEYDWVWVSNTVYVYSPTDPDTKYNSIEISYRSYCIHHNTQEYLTFEGLDLRYAKGMGTKAQYGATYLKGMKIKNCEIAYFGIKEGAVGYGISDYHSYALYTGNIIHDCGRRSIALYLNLDEEYTGLYHDVIVENNIFYNGFHTTGIDFATAYSNTVSNFTFRNNVFYDDSTKDLSDPENYGSSAISLIRSDNLTTWKNIRVYNNVMMGFGDKHMYVSNVDSTYIYNNTFYNINPTHKDLYAMIYLTGGSNRVEIKNNIFYNNCPDDGSPHFYCIRAASPFDNIDIDYNLYYMSHDSYFFQYYPTSYRVGQWAAYKSSSGFDSHSPTPGNPLFVSNTDFHLRAGSPAIAAGIDIPGYTADFNGVQVSSPPNIGAFEGGPVSIEPLNYNESGFYIFPNPADKYINIHLVDNPNMDQLNIRIFDLTGKKTFEGLIDKGQSLIKISINFDPGFYIIQLVSNGSIIGAQELIVN